MKKSVQLVLTLLFVAVFSIQATFAAAAKFPERGLEFVAGYKPGGGHDTMLRMMVKVLKDESIIEVPITVINKPGGSSAVSMGYLNGKKGNGHYLMSITSSHITTPLKSNIKLDYSNFTPIARLGVDPELLVINAAGPYETMDDIMKQDKVFNVGGTGTGSIEHIVAIQFAKKTGKKINYIPYQGDGEVVAALLSNQLDFTITNPGPVADFIATGKFKALAISTDERIDNMPSLPTFKEQGIDIALSLYRGVTAPAGISAEAKAYLIGKMKELNSNPQWKAQYLVPNSVVPGLLIGDDFKAYLETTEKVYRETMTELGIIKK